MAGFLDTVRERVVIYDGAFGTGIQQRGLTADDFGGEAFEGCNELLVVTRPDIIGELHASYLEVGVDVIETCTFGGLPATLGEYGLADRAHELNLAGARLARDAADSFSTPERPRFVAGSIGPGTKFPSLGQIRFADLRDQFEVQARGLLDGGVDLIIIETMFDLLSAKAAMVGSRRAMAAAGREVPLQVQITMELTGRMLPGTEIAAALSALDAMRPDVIGINCATGPVEMGEHLRYLSQHARMPISCIPNAGLPSVVDGHMHYDLTPEALAEHHRVFVTELGVDVIGGCCGTTPEHLAAVVETCRDLEKAPRHPVHEPGATSIYSMVPFHQETSFLIIGERTNANGSKRFREALLEGDWDTTVAMAKDQVKEGSHVLDVCVDYVGRDGTADMDEVASRFATQSSVPLVLDSTEPQVMEAGLQWLGGRAILNSANLEDSDAPGSRLDRVFTLAREYGAAVICLLIDEEGQARDVEWKLRIAHRIHDLAVDRYGLEPSDLIFDALTFPLSTGDDDLRGDAMATLDAIRRIKEEMPGVHTVLGLSNVSFGLKPAARHVLNSVFLHEAVQAGLDSAIVHAARIMPLNKIPDEQRDVCLDLIYDRRRPAQGDEPAYDPLQALLGVFEDVSAAEVVKEDRSGWSVEQRLSQRIIDGDREELEADLDEAMAGGLSPLAIINDVLLAGMKVVGDLFGAGEMQLPFVLQSAETMKASVAYLEPHMEKDDSGGKGRIVLATVKGDVHDIGKNLVDIILTNNGYKVVNLGIKQPIASILSAVKEHKAQAVGMSGLLVKSTVVMRENLEEMTREGVDIPVLLGGAALTRKYVEEDCVAAYGPGKVAYARDAFDGLDLMDKVVTGKFDGHVKEAAKKREGRPSNESRKLGQAAQARILRPVDLEEIKTRRAELAAAVPVPEPPFWGARMLEKVPLKALVPFLNETMLFQFQWGFRKAGKSLAEYKTWAQREIKPILRRILERAEKEDILRPQAVYGYWRCLSEGDTVILFDEVPSSPSPLAGEARGRSANAPVERSPSERVGDGPEPSLKEVARFTFPRQARGGGLCIADFFRDKTANEFDVIGLQVVTMGSRASDVAREWFADNQYQDYLYLHGLGVEMAEALAEYTHKRIRADLGFGAEDDRDMDKMLKQGYRGSRYSFGYPACPNLADQARLLDLLGASRIGIQMSDEDQLHPEQSTSAIVCHHPQAKYFSV